MRDDSWISTTSLSSLPFESRIPLEGMVTDVYRTRILPEQKISFFDLASKSFLRRCALATCFELVLRVPIGNGADDDVRTLQEVRHHEEAVEDESTQSTTIHAEDWERESVFLFGLRKVRAGAGRGGFLDELAQERIHAKRIRPTRCG